MTPTSPARHRRRWLLRACAALLAAVLVASTVIIVLMARDLRHQDRLDADRRDALSVAEQFALRMDNFAASSADAYEAGIEKLLTTKGQADFKQVKPLIGQVYAAAQPNKKGEGAATGEIALAGVTDLGTDSATVLVAHDSAVPGTGKALHFRWTVSLRKVEGRWLVDGLPPEVTGAK